MNGPQRLFEPGSPLFAAIFSTDGVGAQLEQDGAKVPALALDHFRAMALQRVINAVGWRVRLIISNTKLAIRAQ